MAIPKFEQISGGESLSQLIEMVAKLQKQVQWMMDGKLGDDNIKVNSISAAKLSVDELSAISAHMGKLISGEIYGAYIATAEGTYPKVELSSSGNLIRVWASATKYLVITPAYTGGVPAVEFVDDDSGKTGFIYLDGDNFYINSTSEIHIQAPKIWLNNTAHT